jgi:hypothetical protein
MRAQQLNSKHEWDEARCHSDYYVVVCLSCWHEQPLDLVSEDSKYLASTPIPAPSVRMWGMMTPFSAALPVSCEWACDANGSKRRILGKSWWRCQGLSNHSFWFMPSLLVLYSLVVLAFELDTTSTACLQTVVLRNHACFPEVEFGHTKQRTRHEA